MIKKAIFGGTFDPIHNGHLHIAFKALYNLNLEEVIFMPSGNPPHKVGKKITDSSIRYELIKMAIREEKRFAISDYEINHKELSYTYKTLAYYKEKEPDTEWYFLTGSDCLMELDTWKNVDKIFSLCKFVVFNRPGYKIQDFLAQKDRVEKQYNSKVLYLDLPVLDISSTGIKEAVRNHENISYLMPAGVYNTILQLGLYND